MLRFTAALMLPWLVACHHAPAAYDVEARLADECPRAPAPERLRVATYNIKWGDWSSIESIADALSDVDADVVALQEVDRFTERSRGEDQAQELADRLGYPYVVYMAALLEDPFTRAKRGTLGNAILSRLPLVRAERVRLHSPFELGPRVAIDADVCVGQERVRVVNVHADVYPWASDENLEVVAQKVRAWSGKGTIVLGDFNQPPSWDGPDPLRAVGLTDVLAHHKVGDTFVGDIIDRRLDYVFVDGKLAPRAMNAQVVNKTASDHLPVFVDFDFTKLVPPPPARQPQARAPRAQSLR